MYACMRRIFYVHFLCITYYFVDNIKANFEAYAVFMGSISSLEIYKRVTLNVNEITAILRTF
jgi:hypothetical protein